MTMTWWDVLIVLIAVLLGLYIGTKTMDALWEWRLRQRIRAARMLNGTIRFTYCMFCGQTQHGCEVDGRQLWSCVYCCRQMGLSRRRDDA